MHSRIPSPPITVPTLLHHLTPLLLPLQTHLLLLLLSPCLPHLSGDFPGPASSPFTAPRGLPMTSASYCCLSHCGLPVLTPFPHRTLLTALPLHILCHCGQSLTLPLFLLNAMYCRPHLSGFHAADTHLSNLAQTCPRSIPGRTHSLLSPLLQGMVSPPRH